MKSFDLPLETMVITSTYITNDGLPILQVNHDYDDEDGHDWQFHCGNGDLSMSKMQLVRLGTILKIEPQLVEISDLPIGCIAIRISAEHPWVYERIDGKQ